MLERRAAVGGSCPHLGCGNVAGKIGDESDALTVRRPGYIAECKVAFHRDSVSSAASSAGYREFSVHDVSDLSSIGRDRNLIYSFGVRHGVEHGSGARIRGGVFR